MNNQNYKGFTLVEVAIVMVIMGLVIGLGAGMIGPMMNLSKSRDTKEFMGAAVESVNSWAASNNRLPDAGGAATDFKSVAKTTTDGWARDLIYLYDSNLAPATATKDTICGRKSTSITISNLSITPTQTINNVAFLVISQGEDAQLQTTASDGAITVSRPVAIGSTTTVTLDAANSDIVRWVTLDELRSKIGCQGAQLKIVNNELPYGYENTKYTNKIYIDGGVSGYRWCYTSTPAISGLSFIPINSSTGAKGTAISACTMPPDCSSLASDTNWADATPPVFLNISGVPTTRGSYQIRIMAHDSQSASVSQTNCSDKTFVLTINPQQ